MRRFLLFPLLLLLAQVLIAESRYGTKKWIEYAVGASPLVISAPHGGLLMPEEMSDRSSGVLDTDLHTADLARKIAAAWNGKAEAPAHLVLSLLHRRKLDPNREFAEATQGNPLAATAWKEYHGFLREAIDAAVSRHGFAFLIDIHGHAHEIRRVEIGYGITGDQLNATDAVLDASGVAARCSLADLAARTQGGLAALVRGPRSLGALYEAQGFRAVPSPSDPGPGKNKYFNGGYIVRAHAAAPGTPRCDGVQLEMPRPGIRDTEENRARFAKATAEILHQFLGERYSWKPGQGR